MTISGKFVIRCPLSYIKQELVQPRTQGGGKKRDPGYEVGTSDKQRYRVNVFYHTTMPSFYRTRARRNAQNMGAYYTVVYRLDRLKTKRSKVVSACPQNESETLDENWWLC